MQNGGGEDSMDGHVRHGLPLLLLGHHVTWRTTTSADVRVEFLATYAWHAVRCDDYMSSDIGASRPLVL